jgi:hypothetical protein
MSEMTREPVTTTPFTELLGSAEAGPANAINAALQIKAALEFMVSPPRVASVTHYARMF